MVARTQRLLSGVVFPLAFGVLLLSAAVAMADVLWPTDPGGVPSGGGAQGYDCEWPGNPPGTDQGCCTYAPGICRFTANDPNIAANAGGNAWFRTTHYRWWGVCKTAYRWDSRERRDSTCTTYPQFTCARIAFYSTGPNCLSSTEAGWMWVWVANACDNSMGITNTDHNFPNG
jgi:hypothetical protein